MLFWFPNILLFLAACSRHPAHIVRQNLLHLCELNNRLKYKPHTPFSSEMQVAFHMFASRLGPRDKIFSRLVGFSEDNEDDAPRASCLRLKGLKMTALRQLDIWPDAVKVV